MIPWLWKTGKVFSQQIRSDYEKVRGPEDGCKKKLNVRKIILDRYWVIGDFEVDRSIFLPTLRPRFFLFGYNRKPETTMIRALIFTLTERGIWDRDFQWLPESYWPYPSVKGKEGIRTLKSVLCLWPGDWLLKKCLEKRQERAFYQKQEKRPLEIRSFRILFSTISFRKLESWTFHYRFTRPGQGFSGCSLFFRTHFWGISKVKISLFHGGFPG